MKAKTKYILALILVSAVTFSFTLFGVKEKGMPNQEAPRKEVVQNEPIGGFFAEDKF